MELSEVLGKLKQNKLLLPALAVGGGLGVIVLLRNNSTNNVSIPDALPTDTSTETPSPIDNDGVSDSGVNAILEDQKSFQQSITDFINNLATSLTEALNQQASATEAAFSQVYGSLSELDESAEIAQLQSLISDAYTRFNQQQSIPVEYAYNTAELPMISDAITPIAAVRKTATKSAGSITLRKTTLKDAYSVLKSAGRVNKTPNPVVRNTPISGKRSPVVKSSFKSPVVKRKSVTKVTSTVKKK